MIQKYVFNKFINECNVPDWTTKKPCWHFFSVHQGPPNFFVRGPHKVRHKSSRAGLAKCDCFDIGCNTYTRPNQQMLRKYIVFPLMTKWLRWPDEMTSRDAFGPRAVVWRPLACIIVFKTPSIFRKRCLHSQSWDNKSFEILLREIFLFNEFFSKRRSTFNKFNYTCDRKALHAICDKGLHILFQRSLCLFIETWIRFKSLLMPFMPPVDPHFIHKMDIFRERVQNSVGKPVACMTI